MNLLNISQISQMTQEQLIIQAHNTTAIPSLVILFSVTALVFFFVGLMSISQVSFKKYLKIYFSSMAIVTLVFLALLLLPLQLNDFVNFWVK